MTVLSHSVYESVERVRIEREGCSVIRSAVQGNAQRRSIRDTLHMPATQTLEA